MGEYEDRYPDAYRRDEPATPAPTGDEQRQPRERLSLRTRLGLLAAVETPPAWRHAPGERQPPVPPEPARATPPAAPARRPEHDCRGLGPRGYVRSSARIYEDVCDRLIDDSVIDARDIEVAVNGSEVTLVGGVQSAIAARRAGEVAAAVTGVSRVLNRLAIGPTELRREAGAGGRTPAPGRER